MMHRRRRRRNEVSPCPRRAPSSRPFRRKLGYKFPVRSQGLSILEIVALCTLAMAALYVLYATFTQQSGTPRSEDPHKMSVRAAYYVAGRLRRDIKWAHTARIQRRGTRLILQGPDGEKRIYDFSVSDFALDLPKVSNPSQSGRYQYAKFRKVLFLEKNNYLLKYVIAAYPLNRKISDRPSRKDREFTTVVAGVGWLRGKRDPAQHPYWHP